MDMSVDKSGAYDLTLKVDLLFSLILSYTGDKAVTYRDIAFFDLFGKDIDYTSILEHQIRPDITTCSCYEFLKILIHGKALRSHSI